MTFCVMTVRTNALVRVLCSNCAALAQKMLAQHRLLALVVGANVGSIEHIGLLGHSFEGELADWLSVLDHKRHIARTDLECRPASARLATARLRLWYILGMPVQHLRFPLS